MIVPKFPLTGLPAEWDALTLLASLVFLEAEGEPDAGRLAVAWVVRNRADRWQETIHGIILKPKQFSCFNDEYFPTMGYARLAAASEVTAERCWWAAAGGLWRLAPDPTGGADHYANLGLTKRMRKDGHLPKWLEDAVRQGQETAVIGAHTFFRLG